MLAKLRLTVDRRRAKRKLHSSAAAGCSAPPPSSESASVDVRRFFCIQAAALNSSYPSLNQAERFCNPREPFPPSSAVAEPVLSPEEQDALLARQMAEEEEREQADREERDEQIARELAEKEQARYDREQAEAERLARELEEELFDQDLRRENGVLECPVCLSEFYKGEPKLGARRSALSIR